MAVRRKAVTTYRAPDESEPMEYQINDKVFHFYPTMAGMDLLDFVEAFDGMDFGDDPNNVNTMALVANAKVFTQIIFKSILPAEQDDLHNYLKDPKNNVGIEILFDMATWLLEGYTNGHPTESSSSSSDGSPTNGHGPTDALSSGTGLTSVPPPPSI